ncbi:hypothetical protein [Syntrophotalea acetylenivorans]|uniref:hypothetical protein n=1 Tax=Syntrophotalea acetylenivorans TaxID=1842532 RepID=UPI001314724E|nr:hypothetical protein [Syntrophotalea acetylenivorans]
MEAVSDRREFPILKYRQGQTSEVSDVVVAEYNLAIQVNGRDFVILLCTPVLWTTWWSASFSPKGSFKTAAICRS